MEISSSRKETTQHQFDSVCKAAIRGEKKDYYKEMARRSAREVSFSELLEQELNQLLTYDEYPSDFYHFTIMGYDVAVKDALLGEALTALPEHKRDVILMSFFMEMSDAEIGRQMSLDRSTVRHHRTSSYSIIRKFIEEVLHNEPNKD